MSGFTVSYAQLGRPNAGLVALHDVAVALDKICGRVSMFIMVDFDSGFGNVINVARRTV
ncbi:MAG: hypothetical protein AB7F79_12955 [Steroidobacteraceae bacterium]